MPLNLMDRLRRAWQELRTSSPKSAPMDHQVAELDDLAKAIQRAIARDISEGRALSHGEAFEGGWAYDGYCAAASAAYFHLSGGSSSGLQPMQRTADGSSHWWLVDSHGRIIDLTLGPNDDSSWFPYQEGSKRGFTNAGYKHPPARAQALMDMVNEEAGRSPSA